MAGQFNSVPAADRRGADGRLLAGCFDRERMKLVAESMDLSHEDLAELIDRAEREWREIVNNISLT